MRETLSSRTRKPGRGRFPGYILLFISLLIILLIAGTSANPVPPPAECGFLSVSSDAMWASSQSSYVLTSQWGSLGSGEGQFYSPTGIARDSSGDIYIADSNNHRIQKFSPDGAFILEWGSQGTAEGQFESLWGLATDTSDNIYVTNSGTMPRVEKFSSDGTFITQWGSYGTDKGQFLWPTGITIDQSGDVIVADHDSDRLQKFTYDGMFVDSWGTPGFGNGQFNKPCGVAADTSGNIYVVDSYNQRVQEFSPDGVYIAQWGTRNRESAHPGTISVDLSGNIFVTQPEEGMVREFTSDGTLISGWAIPVSGSGLDVMPHSIVTDPSGKIYVTDYDAHRVLVFSPSTPPLPSEEQTSSSSDIVVTKTISPSSIKEGIESVINISVENRGQAAVHDVEVLDPPSPVFPITAGVAQGSFASIGPGETRMLTYQVKAIKAGSFRLNRTTVMYADESGNYHLAYSGYPAEKVLPSLLASGAAGSSNDPFSNLVSWINGFNPFS